VWVNVGSNRVSSGDAGRQQADRLSLHVWADNATARAFYQCHGFVALGTAEVVRHPRLDHVGGSILMSKTLR
jgi:hypothetical protein